ncbi:alpha/beta hydrolase [Paenibacillus sp. J5C_2022]|uniref:alpha/beta hydrolase n=1 Tax=Paenibacillus sp. J5C2022 TaxID=2977129 RepID=UPI0021D0DF0E|nr:alpha/beta hydrolase [Paenibacillus sp. J5C2022]MCU6709700.1 alpha/beta hydrolase [Paenibacillus sp. J5C2022]
MKIELWPEGAPYALGNHQGDRPAITAYFAEKKGSKQPAVVVLPGGAYHAHAPHEGEPIARWLNTLGITAFVLEYRVAPYRHPVPLMDAKRALRLIRSRAEAWDLDPTRLGVLGFSAGGHLASTVGIQYDNGDMNAIDEVDRFSCRADFMILCYPVITMGEFGHDGSRLHLLGENPTNECIQLLSSERQVAEDTPPTFLWHTSDDSAVPVENALLLAGALSRCKVPFELHSYQTGSHGLGLAESHPEARTWPDLCSRWLKRIGVTV